MPDQSMIRLTQVARELGVGVRTIIEKLSSDGGRGMSPNAKISYEQYTLLQDKFKSSRELKEEAHEIQIGSSLGNVVIDIESRSKENENDFIIPNEPISKIIAEEKAIQLTKPPAKTYTSNTTKIKPDKVKDEKIALTIVGKIDLDALNRKKKPKQKASEEAENVKVASEQKKDKVAEKTEKLPEKKPEKKIEKSATTTTIAKPEEKSIYSN